MELPVINEGKTLSCNSQSIIYCTECTKCRKQYVGQTIRSLKDRAEDHLNPTRNRTPTTGQRRNNLTTYCCGNKMDLKPTNLETEWLKLNTY